MLEVWLVSTESRGARQWLRLRCDATPIRRDLPHALGEVVEYPSPLTFSLDGHSLAGLHPCVVVRMPAAPSSLGEVALPWPEFGEGCARVPFTVFVTDSDIDKTPETLQRIVPESLAGGLGTIRVSGPATVIDDFIGVTGAPLLPGLTRSVEDDAGATIRTITMKFGGSFSRFGRSYLRRSLQGFLHRTDLWAEHNTSAAMCDLLIRCQFPDETLREVASISCPALEAFPSEQIRLSIVRLAAEAHDLGGPDG